MARDEAGELKWNVFLNQVDTKETMYLRMDDLEITGKETIRERASIRMKKLNFEDQEVDYVLHNNDLTHLVFSGDWEKAKS